MKYNNRKLIKTLQRDFRDSKVNSFSPNLSMTLNHNLSSTLNSTRFFDRLDYVKKIIIFFTKK